MKVIILEQFLDFAKKEIPDIEFYGSVDECKEAEVIIGYYNFINPEILDRFPNLKWVQLLSAGYDHIDLNYLKKRNITLTNARGIYSIPIAEDVVFKILMNSTNAFNYLENQKNHLWDRKKERTELCGQTVGIIGTGSIATEVAKRLKGFDVKVVGYKRTPVDFMPYFDEIYTGDELSYVLSISDYVVVTVDLNDQTFHMFNKENLKYMKKEASIINIARGKVINEQDLIEMLNNKEISYAGLDVFDVEPLPAENKLWDLDNVYVTPHTSCHVKNNKERIIKMIKENIARYLKSESLVNFVRID